MPDTAVQSPTLAEASTSHSMDAQNREDAKDLVNRITQDAHGAADRIAEKAAPAVEKLEASVADANEALHDQIQTMRELGEQWTSTVRKTVQENPLACVVVSLVAGALISRVLRDNTYR